MKRLLVSVVLLLQAPFAGTPTPTPVPTQDVWKVAIADLQVLIRGSVYQAKLDQNQAATNGSSIVSVGNAVEFNRADAESRVSAFIHDLCSRDILSCNVALALHGLRFAPAPNPFVPTPGAPSPGVPVPVSPANPLIR